MRQDAFRAGGGGSCAIGERFSIPPWRVTRGWQTPFEPGAEAPGQPHAAVARAKPGGMTGGFRRRLERRGGLERHSAVRAAAGNSGGESRRFSNPPWRVTRGWQTPFEPGAEAPGQAYPAMARAKPGGMTGGFRRRLERRGGLEKDFERCRDGRTSRLPHQLDLLRPMAPRRSARVCRPPTPHSGGTVHLR